MRLSLLAFLAILQSIAASPQTPKTYTSSEILMQIKKLNVLGSVLYIAAHPDDENTRLLAYLANEKLYRTGYLSLTRGDGGQNLIGDEQGIDLGLIRTQELLSARRIDGAEQFFSRAYDFGFCKTAEEALATWGHEKILSDVVWVIRNFKPDVIIARFPEDSRAGHGHHAASGILAREAFEAAGDSSRFPEQLSRGTGVWQAKRLLWNTFNFGSTNTQREDQFKVDVGMYNPLLGKGYGEIAAVSRSQHKSQGFGVPAQRGTVLEYFTTIKGDKPVSDLMDGVDISWARTSNKEIAGAVKNMVDSFNVQHPELTVQALTRLKSNIETIDLPDSIRKISSDDPAFIERWMVSMEKQRQKQSQQKGDYWRTIKSLEIIKLIENAGGLFMEATAANQLNVIGDSIRLNLTFNNRAALPVEQAMISVFGTHYYLDSLKTNENITKTVTLPISDIEQASQPYWLERGLEKGNGSFDVRDQAMIGAAENYNYKAHFQVKIRGVVYDFFKPVLFKYTDPVKGELYQPIQIVHPVFINSKESLVIFKNEDKGKTREVEFTLQFNHALADSAKFRYNRNGHSEIVFDSMLHVSKTATRNISVLLNSDDIKKNTKEYLGGQFSSKPFKDDQFFSLARIKYDHIPDIFYNYYDGVTVLKMDLKITGNLVGYIAGAGDKVPQSLEQMGYRVVMLKQSDISFRNLKQFDAIITGVRAYNVNDWMNSVYDQLMRYVEEGGVLLTQYNTSNQIGPLKARMAPYPFNISRSRVTDENARVSFLVPDHPALNYPNKITEKDFEGWIQERSIYNADKIDSNYQRILGMNDAGEESQDGSLVIADYGKGKFVYTGLVFFRQLPAGVPGAYRLMANLLAARNSSAASKSSTTRNPPVKKTKIINRKDGTK